MTKPKTLEQLRTEKERAETQLAQEQHKLERLENRKKYLEKGERTKRTHRLCNLGGTIESLAPEVKDTWMIFKWVFKSAAAILIVTNTWNIVMGVFDMAQSVVAQAAGIINSDASIDISSVMTDLEPRLMEMDLGPLFGLWFQSLFIGITMWALYICIFIVIYGRMIEIYLVTSVAPVPMAAMMGKEWGGMGQNYLRSLLALGFQAFLIIVCVAIYAVLVQNIALEDDIIMAIWSCVGYTVLLCFTLFKTGSLAKSVFQAH